MKRSIFTIVALSLSLSQGIAQKIYFKAGIGNAWKSAGQTFNANGGPLNGSISYSSQTGRLSTYDVKTASFGAGMYGNLGIGFMFNKNIGVEMNGLIGLKMKKFSGTESYPDGINYYSQTMTMYADAPIIINPAVRIQSGKKINVFARGGLLLPLGVNVIGDYTANYSNPNIAYAYTFAGKIEYATRFSVGYSGAVGLSLNILKHTNFWIEGNLNSLSVRVKRKPTRNIQSLDRTCWIKCLLT